VTTVATEVGQGKVTIVPDAAALETGLTQVFSGMGGKFSALGGLLGKKVDKGAAEQLGGSGSMLGGALGNVTGLMSKAGPWGMAAAAVTAATVGIGAGLYKLGDAFNKQYRQIARDTGATGVQLDKLKQSYRDVLSGTAASMGDVEKAIVEVQRYTGPAGVGLDALSHQFLTLSRITGTDVSTNVNAGIQVIERWNVAQKDASKAMDALFRASQLSGTSFSELSSSMQRYAPAFKDLGLNFNESAGMLATLNKEGMNTPKVLGGVMMGAAKLVAPLKALKPGATGLDIEFNKLATVAQTNLPRALQLTFDAIKGTHNQTEALALSTKLFSARAGGEMVTAIKSGRWNFQQFTKEINNSGGSIDDTAAKTATLGGTFAKLKNTTMVALAPIATAVNTGINKALIGAMNAITPLITAFGQWLPGAMKQAQPYLDAIGTVLGGIIKFDWTIWATEFKTAFKVIGDVFHILGPELKIVGDTLGFITDILTGKWSAAWQKVVDIPKEVGAAFKGFGKLLWDLIATPLTGLWSATNSLFRGMPSKILNAITGAFRGAGSWLYNMGRDIILGLVHGVESMAGSVVKSIKGILESPITLGKKILHIFSPSQVMHEMGQNLMLGLLNGINAVGPQIAPAVVGSVPSRLGSLGFGVNGAGAGPAVFIQEANFTGEADVELLMRKAAWAVQTRRA
jgi:TP901 family phage tail tape measure protein